MNGVRSNHDSISEKIEALTEKCFGNQNQTGALSLCDAQMVTLSSHHATHCHESWKTFTDANGLQAYLSPAIAGHAPPFVTELDADLDEQLELSLECGRQAAYQLADADSHHL